VHKINDADQPFTLAKDAMTRAMHVNGCSVGTGYDSATFEDFPTPGNTEATCKKIVGCPDKYPLVVCPFTGYAQTSTYFVTNPAFSKFIRLLEVAPPGAP
jgi:hypothetical protein